MNTAQKTLMEKALQYLVNRLKEPVTWIQLLTALGTIVGINMKPEMMEIIATVGVAVAGGVGVAMPSPTADPAAPTEPAAQKDPPAA